MADSEAVYLSSDSEVDDKIQNEFSRGKKHSFHCTACGTEMFGISEIHEHPWLHGVGICSDCFDFLFNTSFTKDPIDGADEHCRWCGQGGTIVMCDNCEKAFCEDCIVYNYGRKRGLAPILSNDNWSCFCCNPQPLWVHVNRLKEFRNSVSSKRNFSPRLKDARTSKTRHASQNASDVNRGTSVKLLRSCWLGTKSKTKAKGFRQNPGTGRPERSLQLRRGLQLLVPNSAIHQKPNNMRTSRNLDKKLQQFPSKDFYPTSSDDRKASRVSGEKEADGG